MLDVRYQIGGELRVPPNLPACCSIGKDISFCLWTCQSKSTEGDSPYYTGCSRAMRLVTVDIGLIGAETSGRKWIRYILVY